MMMSKNEAKVVSKDEWGESQPGNPLKSTV